MNSMEDHSRRDQRRRGAILRLIRAEQANQHKDPLDHIQLWRMLQDLSFRMGEYEIITLLQDLCALNCVSYKEVYTPKTGELILSDIKIAPEGLRIIEKLKQDGLVSF